MSSTTEDTQICVSDILRTVWPMFTAKVVAAALDCSHRTVEGWLQKRTCPDGKHLFRLAETSPHFNAELMRRLAELHEANATTRARGERVSADLEILEMEIANGVERRRVDSTAVSGVGVDAGHPRSGAAGAAVHGQRAGLAVAQ